MPKIIENLKSRLLAEAKKQIEEKGYAATTIRSVAQACGIGVGTVYNYFPSKDALLATYMLEAWEECLAAIHAVYNRSIHPTPVLRCIYDQLQGFSLRYQTLFRDEAAQASFAGAFARYHELLRAQLAMPLRVYCPNAFTSEFIAEAMLTWTTAGKEFDEICPVIEKLFKKKYFK